MQPRGPAGPYSQINRRANRDRVRSGMREFESSHSSQPVRRLQSSHRNLKNTRQLRAFAIQWTVSGLPIWQIEGPKRRKSLGAYRNIPVFGRPALETGFDQHCVTDLAVEYRQILRYGAGNLGMPSPRCQSLTVTGDAVIDGRRGVAIRAHPRNLG